MDGSRKRKAASSANATPSTSGGSATKKIKLLNSNPGPSSGTDTIVQKVGRKLLTQLNNATDKTGRSIIGAFLELPSRDELPDYYEVIKLPIALSTVEEKLNRNAYPTITTLESDLKRMVNNAKEYNEPKSPIYEDAERIRKLIYNFMKLNNPQYRTDPNYSAFPTPIPSTKITLTNGAASSHTPALPEAVKDEPASREGSSNPRLSVAPKTSEAPSDRKSSVAPSAADGGVDEDMDFTGKSFQEAQEMIVAECIRYTDDEGLEIFTPFVNLPSRKLEDYYRFIKHPVSLKGVQKRTRGQHGREPPTGMTDFKTWDAFENEISFIWRNAKDYNEDGSEMYTLANDFEKHFKSRLAEAKEHVKEPASTRLKLGGPQPAKSGFTINLSQHRNSPTPGVSVDKEALARQTQMVQAGVNGHQRVTPQPTAAANGTARPHSQGKPPEVSTPAAIPPASTPPATQMKASTMSLEPVSPAPIATPAIQPATNGMMPPPLARPPSSSSFPPQPGMPVNSYYYTAPSALPAMPSRSYPSSQALLPAVTIGTHPQLSNIPKPYSISITPHSTLTHQSTTITLPATHYYLQISPTISRELSMGRAYKMFVTVNGTRLTQRDTQFHTDTGRRTHVYEGSLASGVNRIEVEVAAVQNDSRGDGKGLDVEKVTVYANLTRS